MMIKIAALLVALLPAQEDPAARVRRALDWYADTDPKVRELGRKELRAIGPDAVPHLEKLLELREAIDIYRLIRDIDRLGKEPGTGWVSGADLPSEEEITRDLPSVERREAEKYVRLRMAEAFGAAKSGDYQRGYDLAQALLILEPKSRHAEPLRKIRRYCDNWIIQMSLVRSRVILPAAGGAAAGPHEVTLRMENVFKGGVRLLYDRGTDVRPSTPVVVVEIACDKLEPNGTVTNATRTQEVVVEHEIPIAMGAQWERVFAFETAGDFPGDEDFIRVYTIGAWTQPSRIEYAGGSTLKRILFEPAVFKVVPGKHRHMLEDPLAALDRAIGSGTVNEVFVAAMLLPEEQKVEGLARLVPQLETSQTEAGRIAVGHILTVMTGRKLGTDPRKWREHLEEILADPSRKKRTSRK